MAADRPAGPGSGGKGREERVLRRLRTTTRPQQNPIGPVDRGEPLYLSAGQQQMWFLQQFEPESSAYLMSWVLRVRGPLETEALRRAWEKVVERHEVLRTRYSQSGDEPIQVIDPPSPFTLRVVDLTGVPVASREETARQLAQSERRTAFDLTTEHPVRVILFAGGAGLHYLVVAIHHIACDATSYTRIAAEVNSLYSEYSGGPPADLPEVGIQYADFAAYERAGRAQGTLRTHLDYWRRVLSDVKGLPLPLDRPAPARPDSRCGLVDIAIKPETSDGIRALARAHRATPQMVLLAAYQVLLSHLTESDDVTVGVPVSGRTMPVLDDLVGYMVNTVVVRSEHTAGDTFAGLLDQVRNRFLEALDHRAAPFKWVVDEVKPARGTSANTLVRVGFDTNEPDEGAFQLPGLQVEYLDLDAVPAAKFDLTLHVGEDPDGTLSAQLEYAAAVIDRESAQAWAARYETLVDAVVRLPHDPLARVEGQQGLERAPGAGSTGRNAARAPADGPEPAAGEPAREVAVDVDRRGRLLTTIHHIWCEVLGRDDAGAQENFFDAGGDSLRAVALAGRLKAAGLDISAADIFAHQTIAALTDACLASPGRPASPVRPSTPPFAMVSEEDRAALPPGVVDAYPLAMLQLGMIVEMRALPDVNPYQDSTSFLVRDDRGLDAVALQEAAQTVVDRHEVLRTTFDLNSYSAPLQLVHGHASISVGFTDHGVLGPEGWRPRLEDFAAQERRSLIDMSRAPLIRVHGHTAEGTNQWWLTITEFHPILEGWSFHDVLMEMLTCYQEFRDGRNPAEPATTSFRYADYIAAEAEALRSEDDRAYWRKVIEGRPGVMLPSAWRAGSGSPRERYQHMVSFRDLEDGLRGLAAETRTSMKAVLLAAHLKVMSMISGSERFVSGLVCDARPEVLGADRVPGMYLNTLPFAMPTGARTWGDLVRAVYDGLTELWPHRTFPMRAIQQEFGGGDRLLEIFYNYTDFRQVDRELIDYDQTLNDNENEFALHVFTTVGVVKLNTTTQSLSREGARRLGAIYRTVLEAMCRGRQGDASSACLPAEETARLLAHGSGPELAREPATVVKSFAKLVRDRPDAPAVRRGEKTLTYAQLDARAEDMARRLRRSGVGAGDLVAVEPKRAAETIAALLGVWKTGAAWTFPGTVGPAMWPGGLEMDAEVSAVVTATCLPLDVACVLPGDLSDEPAGEPADEQAWEPAGVLVSHRALAQAVDSLCLGLEAVGGQPAHGSSWLLSSALPSWRGVSELLMPITTGGAVVIPTSDAPRVTDEAEELLADGAVTHVQVPPLVAERMSLAGPYANRVTVVVGGDRMVSATGPDRPGDRIRLVPALGAGPIPGWVAFHGRPLPGRIVRILDAGLRPVPDQVAGELCIGGAGMPDCIFGDPARTADHFVPDPFGSRGERLFRTGRLARFAADGTVALLGSIERHVGRGGRIVEPYRTRELLDEQLSVRDSQVLVRHGSAHVGLRLLAYVRGVAGEQLAPRELLKSLAEKLPRDQVPVVLTQVDEWPLTARGTLDLEALPEPEEADDAPSGDRKPWDDQFEELLRTLADPATGDIALASDRPLIDYGLDSLTFVRLFVSLEQAYGIVIPDEMLIVDTLRTPKSLWEEILTLRTATSEATGTAQEGSGE